MIVVGFADPFAGGPGVGRFRRWCAAASVGCFALSCVFGGGRGCLISGSGDFCTWFVALFWWAWLPVGCGCAAALREWVVAFVMGGEFGLGAAGGFWVWGRFFVELVLAGCGAGRAAAVGRPSGCGVGAPGLRSGELLGAGVGGLLGVCRRSLSVFVSGGLVRLVGLLGCLYGWSFWLCCFLLVLVVGFLGGAGWPALALAVSGLARSWGGGLFLRALALRLSLFSLAVVRRGWGRVWGNLCFALVAFPCRAGWWLSDLLCLGVVVVGGALRCSLVGLSSGDGGAGLSQGGVLGPP